MSPPPATPSLPAAFGPQSLPESAVFPRDWLVEELGLIVRGHVLGLLKEKAMKQVEAAQVRRPATGGGA